MIEAADEGVRPPSGPGFGDAVTFAFGDEANGLFGSARLGLVPGEPSLASGLALLFDGGDVAAVAATGAIELDAPADWTEVEAGDVSARIVEPLACWDVAFDGDDGGFELRFEALAEPAEVGSGAVAASAAALHGYEQLCRVTGTVRVGERRTKVACLGQRGHQWGAPDWERIELARTVALWLDDASGVTLASVRPLGAAGHDEEAVSAYLSAEGAAVAIADPRLSTATDLDGRQLRAGLELWVEDDADYPHRAAGEAVCGTTLDLGRLQLHSAFFRWRMEGRAGVGRYDMLRRA